MSNLDRPRLKQFTPCLWEYAGLTVTQPDHGYAVLTGLLPEVYRSGIERKII